MRVFACNVVSKLQRNRCITFGDLRSWTTWPLHFYIYRWVKQRKVWWLRDDSHVAFGWKIPGEKWSKRQCIVVMQQPVLLSPKFGAKSLHIFTQSPWNISVVWGIDCLGCQDKFFVNNPLDVKESDEPALDFALHLSCLIWSRWVWTFRLRLILSSLIACLIIGRVSFALFSEICTKFDDVSILGPLRNCIRPDSWLQIKGHKESAHPPTCLKFCTLTPKMC
jgi:hypothetical protein